MSARQIQAVHEWLRETTLQVRQPLLDLDVGAFLLVFDLMFSIRTSPERIRLRRFGVPTVGKGGEPAK